MERAAPRRASGGFTLLELMVVLILVGVIISMAVLSVGDGGRTALIHEEAKRLHALFRLAADEAVLLTETYGVELRPDHYRFLQLDKDTREWRPAGDKMFAQRELPELVRPQLYLEELPVSLEDWEGEMDEEGNEKLKPQIVFYASGERTPFELVIGPEEGDPRFRISAEIFGQLQLEGPLERFE
jgi:general secretion pathway protein H